MPNFLPILLIGGAALALSGKKKSKGSGGIPLDKPVQVKKDGLVVNSGRSPVPPAVYEAPLEPFEDVQQVQEALIAAGKPPKGGADGEWGGQSQAALDSYNHDRGFVNEARDHLATPDSLRALHADAGQGTADGVLANPQTGAGTSLYCSLSNPKCPPGQHCLPLFSTPIPGFEDIGYCVPIPMLEAGYEPTTEDYAPGGFNEVVFSPDFESVSIGGGWRFQTLEPWLYTRMKAGKLLTFALEGGLFWEDLISKSPKSFWNSTLASVGLAVPAGAAIGTKGWLSYRQAFRREILTFGKNAKYVDMGVKVWRGPGGFIPGPSSARGVFTEYRPGSRLGEAASGLHWPPPKAVVEEWAGWKEATRKKTSYGEFVELVEPDGLHKVSTFENPGRPKYLQIKSWPDVAAPPGQSMFTIYGDGIPSKSGIAGPPITVAASSMDEAIDIAKSKTPNRVARMMELWSFGAQVERRNIGKMAEIVGRRISWATPALKQAAKGIGIPMVVAAVIGGAMYGADYLAKKLGDKQRDLIAESAALAWGAFAESNYVRVGSEQVRIDQLPEVVAVQFFQAFVAQSILRFQKSTYE